MKNKRQTGDYISSEVGLKKKIRYSSIISPFLNLKHTSYHNTKCLLWAKKSTFCVVLPYELQYLLLHKYKHFLTSVGKAVLFLPLRIQILNLCSSTFLVN